ncbi:MAG: hypothetical protein U1E30_07470 [Rhodoblastus sp.]
MSNSERAPDREDLAALAPWYAAGLLTPEENARFEAELAVDPALRANLDAARAELEIVQQDIERAGAPSPHVWNRIAAAVAAQPRKPTFASRVRATCLALVERAAAAPVLATSLASAAALVIVAESGALLRHTTTPPASYQTASEPNARKTGAELLVAFTPETTVGRMTAILAAHGAAIVDGPRAGGLYRVALAAQVVTPEDINKATTALRAEPGVALVLPAPPR